MFCFSLHILLNITGPFHGEYPLDVKKKTKEGLELILRRSSIGRQIYRPTNPS